MHCGPIIQRIITYSTNKTANMILIIIILKYFIERKLVSQNIFVFACKCFIIEPVSRLPVAPILNSFCIILTWGRSSMWWVLFPSISVERIGCVLKAVSALLLSSPMSGLSANICCGAFQENMLWFLSKSSRGKMLCILLVKHVFSIGVLKIIQSNPTMIKHTLKIIESHSWSINKILALFSEQNLRSALWECLLWLTQRWQCLHT